MSKSKSRSSDVPTLPPEIEILADSATFSGASSLALAGRMTMAKHTRKLYTHLPGVLSGDNPHDIHQMRVATRRLRASLQSTAIAYQPKPVDALRKGFRRLARALGAVRDLDVLLLRLRADAEHAGIEREEVDQRIAQLVDARAAAHDELISELHSKRSARLYAKLNDFLLCPLEKIQAEDGGLPLLLRHHAGGAIWQEFEAVQRFESVMPRASSEHLHELRIACKHLRYTLELFEPALGKHAREMIKEVETIQEHLGLIHDADVAIDYFGGAHTPAETISESDTSASVAERSHDDSSDGLAQIQAEPETAIESQQSDKPRYIDTRIAERSRLLQEFEPMWEQISSKETRRKLGKLIATL
jgi:CHAD domain-containing protein